MFQYLPLPVCGFLYPVALRRVSKILAIIRYYFYKASAPFSKLHLFKVHPCVSYSQSLRLWWGALSDVSKYRTSLVSIAQLRYRKTVPFRCDKICPGPAACQLSTMVNILGIRRILYTEDILFSSPDFWLVNWKLPLKRVRLGAPNSIVALTA